MKQSLKLSLNLQRDPTKLYVSDVNECNRYDMNECHLDVCVGGKQHALRLVSVPLLVRRQALDVLRIPVCSSRDSGRSRHPSAAPRTCSRRRRHLNTEIREDPDHPRARTAMLHRPSMCVDQPSLRSDKSQQHNPISDGNNLICHSASCFLLWEERSAAFAGARRLSARPVRLYAEKSFKRSKLSRSYVFKWRISSESCYLAMSSGIWLSLWLLVSLISVRVRRQT